LPLASVPGLLRVTGEACETWHVDTPMIIECIRGRDNRLYPAGLPLPVEWRWRVITLCHELAHERGMSVRAVQGELWRRGIRRSRGSVWYDLGRRPWPTCPACREPSGG
jgi:hypothetical protein